MALDMESAIQKRAIFAPESSKEMSPMFRVPGQSKRSYFTESNVAPNLPSKILGLDEAMKCENLRDLLFGLRLPRFHLKEFRHCVKLFFTSYLYRLGFLKVLGT
jgi:hypothetical protein